MNPAAAPGLTPAVLDTVTVPAEVAAAYRAGGWWRTETFLHDLRRTAALSPARPAIVAHRLHRPAGRRVHTVTYAQLAAHVERFAAALHALGVRPGEPVAYQLPAWWETTALTLACLRLGAVAVPVLPTVRSHELAQTLRLTGARVCVVPDAWEGHPHAEALADLAGNLPWLRHRVVLGDATTTGAVDFARHFLHTSHPPAPQPRTDADRPALAVSVMTTDAAASAVLHTPNTLYANISAQHDPTGPGRRPHEVFYSALPLTSLASLLYTVCWPLAVGGTGVCQDVWDPDVCLDLLDTAGVHQAYAAPVYWTEVLAAQRRRPRQLRRLRLLLSGGRTSTAGPLLDDLRDALGAPARNLWGAPEVGMGTLTKGDTPAEREGRSDGLPLDGLQVSVLPRPGHEGATPGALCVRGPSVCLARWHHGETAPALTWADGDGWLGTGDTALGDGLGGIRVTERAGTRTGSIFMAPVDLIERELLAHPGVAEAAVVAHTDPDLGERTCAVLVPAADQPPPALLELREHLAARGIGEAFLPTRMELVSSLPRDDHGAVRHEGLRRWIARLLPGQPRTTPITTA
ncbi:AMP-binding protein [Streptomyces sp. SP17BM10]|uniref:AMP-binding protein n=1 Tax=Streptomyces sp. SP17BM10 TaxID=3002530 RepID=UPI002E7867F7|nr:AMP-binding protein [Streptomyces sp. SP17BM10]MEE1781610.1 AMP-binding protein [Streptomyces sp. SP17BM10]